MGAARRSRWCVAAVSVALVVVGCARVSPSGTGSSPGTTPPVSPSGSATPSPTPTPTPSTAPTAAPHPHPVLRPGSRGEAVRRLQVGLSRLGYWLGRPDGVFGAVTEQAVYALQKAAGLRPDGVVGPATWRALDRGVLPHARSAHGRVVEVDLRRDLFLIVTNGRIDAVLNTSTGGGYTYTADGVTAVAETPVGHFRIYRQVDGLVVSSLGELWRPKYFDAGFAIHGAPSVPPVPVSHGCVRVSNAAIDWIWAEDLMPIGTAVWIY